MLGSLHAQFEALKKENELLKLQVSCFARKITQDLTPFLDATCVVYALLKD